MMRPPFAMTVAAGLLALLARGAWGGEPTYSLGVTPLVQVAPNEPTSPGADEANRPGFFGRLFRAYYDSFNPPPTVGIEPEPPRRGLPAPLESPPFPSAEWQGYPLVGVRWTVCRRTMSTGASGPRFSSAATIAT
jgi:hypothetical protein